MSRNILWIFLVIAPLVSASSLETLEATCNGSGPLGCSGIYTNGPDVSFSFSGFFDGFNQRFGPMPPNPSGIVLAPGGTHGGDTTYQGHLCNNDVANHGGCGAEVSLQANLGMPSDTGLSLGDVASIEGPGTAKGFFCWGAACAGHDPTSFPPVFDLDVHATYEFTLTDPGTPQPFSWTAARFSLEAAPVPEPATWEFAIFGLAAVAAGFRGRRRYRRMRS